MARDIPQILGSSSTSLFSDKINATGNLFLDDLASIFVKGTGYIPTFGDTFTLIDWTGTLTTDPAFSLGTNMRTGKDSDLNEGNLNLPDISTYGFFWVIQNSFNNEGSLTIAVSGVPEPSRGLLLFAGVALVVLRRRRRRQGEGLTNWACGSRFV